MPYRLSKKCPSAMWGRDGKRAEPGEDIDLSQDQYEALKEQGLVEPRTGPVRGSHNAPKEPEKKPPAKAKAPAKTKEPAKEDGGHDE